MTMMRSKFNFIILTIFLTSASCSVINEHVKHMKMLKTSLKYTVEDLLTMTFPYSDPREGNNQYDMDPCKSGRHFSDKTFLHNQFNVSEIALRMPVKIIILLVPKK